MTAEAESEKKHLDRMDSISFLQNQIAKYYGNDGELSQNERDELAQLCKELDVSQERYDRLVRLAKSEIENFKKYDVMSYLLGREDKMKLYSDAEKLSIRISRVERWIADLQERATPDKTNRKSPTEKRRSTNLVRTWFELPLLEENPNDDKNKLFTIERLLDIKDKNAANKELQHIDDIRKYYKLSSGSKRDYSAEDEKTSKGKLKIENLIRESYNRPSLELLGDQPKVKISDHFTKSELKSILNIRYLERDIEQLLEKSGYVEKNECIDVEKHGFALIIYVICVLLAALGIYNWLFLDLDLLHRDMEEQQAISDDRDGESYNVVEIGDIKWMTRNINYDVPGSLPSELPKDGGRLYSWNQAIAACPDGWRMPTVEEWQLLIHEAGGDSVAAFALKSRGMWDSGHSNDSLGFSALPAGDVTSFSRKSVKLTNELGAWWAYSMANEKEAYQVKMVDKSNAVAIVPAKIEIGLSVRCVKINDENVPRMIAPTAYDSLITKKYKGTVIGFRDQSNLPIVKYTNGKKDSLYNVEQVNNIKCDNVPDSDPKYAMENIRTEKRPLFLQNALVNMKRFYARTFVQKNDSWVRDSIWLQDSVTISGKFPIVDYASLANDKCNTGFKAGLGQDSIVVVKLDMPCTSISLATDYQLTVDFMVKKPQNCTDNCADLVYHIISSEAHIAR